MKNNGFTLIELLGVIILIALISLLSFPTILNQIKSADEQIDKTTKSLVINAAKNYVSDNINNYEKIDGQVYCIDINTLLKNDYLDKTIVDKNDILNNKIVEVKYNTKYNYSLVDSCEVVTSTTSD